MTPLIPYAVLFTALGLAVLLFGKSLTREVAAAYAVLVFAVLAGGVDVMGYAKPIWAEVRTQDEIRPAHIIYHPEVAIYVLTDGAPPRLYRMPWDTERARRMQQAERSGTIALRANDDSGEWIPHAIPQIPNPPKDQR